MARTLFHMVRSELFRVFAPDTTVSQYPVKGHEKTLHGNYVRIFTFLFNLNLESFVMLFGGEDVMLVSIPN